MPLIMWEAGLFLNKCLLFIAMSIFIYCMQLGLFFCQPNFITKKYYTLNCSICLFPLPFIRNNIAFIFEHLCGNVSLANCVTIKWYYELTFDLNCVISATNLPVDVGTQVYHFTSITGWLQEEIRASHSNLDKIVPMQCNGGLQMRNS